MLLEAGKDMDETLKPILEFRKYKVYDNGAMVL
jgi:hypothetical protein